MKKFKDILKEENQEKLRQKTQSLFRTVLLRFILILTTRQLKVSSLCQCSATRYLLKIEERDAKPNKYDLLEEATYEYPAFLEPNEINRPCLVKVL